jgi:glycosyltransferase involved in cell wall biosynthesis
LTASDTAAAAASQPLVVIDADVLGRQRTGDETYVRNLLRELPALAAEAGLRVAAVVRQAELLPGGVEPLVLASAWQELRLSWALPRLLRRVGASLVHTQYAVPVRPPCPTVVTIHDLSFERDPSLMGRKDLAVFKRVVPRAARRAARVLTVSERTKADIEEIYGLAPDRIVVTPNGVDPAFTPGDTGHARDYVLAVGAIQSRKNQLAALAAAQAVGLPLVVVGPAKEPALADELRRRGARIEGYVETDRLVELYRGAACLAQASRYEGFGLPVLEAMACGTPVVTVPEPALLEVVGDAAVVVEEDELADGIRRALRERDKLSYAGLERARAFSWEACAEKTLGVYLDVLGR